MSENGDFDPGPWSGHDFKKARATYDTSSGRSYATAVATGKKASDLVPKRVATKSSAPLVICVDVTGSMDDWPATIFSKLPYLEIEGKEYLGQDLEMCFAANGDYNRASNGDPGDTYPFQVRPFAKGLKLKERLDEIVREGGGGGQGMETYELGALYLARNVDMPQAIRKPILVLIGDEAPYDAVTKDEAASVGINLEMPRISTKEIFEELMEKYSVYLIRKPYGSSSGDRRGTADQAVHDKWVHILGEDRICMLPGADRVVDVIFGILARETDRVAYFQEEIEGRQLPEQVKTVYKSLKTIHAIPATAGKTSHGGGTKTKSRHTGKSVTHKPDNGEDANSLI